MVTVERRTLLRVMVRGDWYCPVIGQDAMMASRCHHDYSLGSDNVVVGGMRY